MNFLSKEQFISCLAAGSLSEAAVRMFWEVLLQLNPSWKRKKILVYKKKVWRECFNRIVLQEGDISEIASRMGEWPRSWIEVPDPQTLFLYPFGISRTSYPGKKSRDEVVVYLREVKEFIQDPSAPVPIRFHKAHSHIHLTIAELEKRLERYRQIQKREERRKRL